MIEHFKAAQTLIIEVDEMPDLITIHNQVHIYIIQDSQVALIGKKNILDMLNLASEACQLPKFT